MNNFSLKKYAEEMEHKEAIREHLINSNGEEYTYDITLIEEVDEFKLYEITKLLDNEIIETFFMGLNVDQL